jgi:hypothetical protein
MIKVGVKIKYDKYLRMEYLKQILPHNFSYTIFKE